MSGILAIMGVPGSSEEAAARRMVERTRLRGPDQAQCWSGEGGLLGVCRAGWELGDDFAGGIMVLEQDRLVVAADATLYYKDDLRRALRNAGVHPTGDSPSSLIAAGYEAWGSQVVDFLEGDYAFVLWDRRRRLLLAARDFAGTRPLHFARVGERLIIASGLAAVAAHPVVPREFNPLALAEDLIGSSSMAVEDTAFRAVTRLPAGARLVWQPGAAPRIERFWEPPVFDRAEGPDPAEAAEQLRALLRAAARERLAADGPTAVWMSGGYDSSAVFAVAQGAARQSSRSVVPVSMSYPEGDPGREDELIEAVGRHTGTAIHWVRAADVPGLPDASSWAERRDQPFAHPYEEWNRTLARGAREAGARVVLSGNGGDQFFSVSPVFLADLARAGRWRDLAREAGAIGLGRRSYRDLFHWAIQPALPIWVLDLARGIRGGRPLKPHLVSAAPVWMGLDQGLAETLWQRQWHYGLRRPAESFGSAETSWYLTASFGQRICSMVMGIVLDEGAEVRSPMYDRRVIEFMARRPREDRYSHGETKVLLRQSMAGLLPVEHLARRPRRTGLPSAYLRRVRREALPRWAEALGTRLRLGDLGLVRPAAVRAALDRYLGNARWEGGTLGGELFNVYCAESWVRTHAAPEAVQTAMVA